MSSSDSGNDVVIQPIQISDIEDCGRMIFEAFDYVMLHFLIDPNLCTPEARLQYRIDYLKYEVTRKSSHVQCWVAKSVTDPKKIIGVAMWKNVHVSTTSQSNNDSDSATSEQQQQQQEQEQQAKPVMPPGLDADKWRTFVAIEDDHAEDALGKQPRKELVFLVVKKEYRDLKVGSRLLRLFLEGDTHLPSYLVSTDAALAFYQRHGFTKTTKVQQNGCMKLTGSSSSAEDSLWPLAREA
jgi:ribosomal protein S18 acetylase RimI-like enzyme